MKYLSTRDKMTRMDAAEAILTGLSRDGGLLTPESIPQIGEDFLRELAGLSYEERAARVMALYLTEYSEAELLKWGAAPSYLRCGDTVKKLGTASLPPGVGVGGDHAPERYRLSLRGGEMLVLVSDGAGDAESTVAGFAGDSPRELAALLIAGLPAEDDMTAVTVALAPRASRD